MPRRSASGPSARVLRVSAEQNVPKPNKAPAKTVKNRFFKLGRFFGVLLKTKKITHSAVCPRRQGLTERDEDPALQNTRQRSTVSFDQFRNHGNDAQDSRKNQYAHSVIACRDIPNFGDFQFVHAPFSHDTPTVIKVLLIQLFGKIQNMLN